MPKFIVSNGVSGARGIDLRWATAIALALCSALVALTTERVTVISDLSRIVAQWDKHRNDDDRWTVHLTPNEKASLIQAARDQAAIREDIEAIKQKLDIE